MEQNMLNRKAIKGKYYQDIEKSMLTKFQPLYPDNTIMVAYSYDNEWYYFEAYINGKTITADGIVCSSILVGKYSNITAINLFANQYKREDFEKEFNDYSMDNIKTLKEEIEKLVEEYKKEANFIFTKVEVNERGYYLKWYHPEYSGTYRSWGEDKIDEDWAGHDFSIIPISKSTMKNAIRDVKKTLARSNAKLIQKALSK